MVTMIGTWSEPQSVPSLSMEMKRSGQRSVAGRRRTQGSPSGTTTSSTSELRPWGTKKWSGRARQYWFLSGRDWNAVYLAVAGHLLRTTSMPRESEAFSWRGGGGGRGRGKGVGLE